MRHHYFTLLLPLMLWCGLAGAQNRYAGSFYVYDYKDAPEMTAAPEGYRPFYISHFARHGARYCTSEYDSLHAILSQADEKGLLTEEGKKLYRRYEAFFRKVRLCAGNLTGVGKDQHRSIGRHMYERFPEVFEGPTHLEAFSTESPRVIMSMFSCLSSLQTLDGDLEVQADASARYCPWLQPNLKSNPKIIRNAYASGKAALEAEKAYFQQIVPCKEIVSRYFTAEDAPEQVKSSPEQFIGLLYSIAADTYCLDTDRGCFDDVFSEEEYALIWRAKCHLARYEGSESLAADYAAYTLAQIIQSADADIADGRTQLRLRFGHDAALAPLVALMNVNGLGRTARTWDEVADCFPSYEIPMGSSLQLIFFRNGEGDILVKPLLNEAEAMLPFPAVSGPYYRWSNFKAYYRPIIHESKHKIFSRDPLAVLKAVDWNWQPVNGTKVEAGGATVQVFGGTQTVSMVRFPMKSHAVSVLSAAGSKADVTSALGTRSKAVAAINGSFFDGNLMPITYVKDEGRVVCAKPVPSGSLFDGMFRIKDRKGQNVDIVRVDSLSTASAAKGWRETIVSGPILLEDGKPVYYENDGTRSFRKLYRRRNPRTLIGYTPDGWIYFVVVDGRFPQADGMTFHEMQVLCESLGMYEALNLDGGGSSTLWTRDKGVLNHPYDNKIFDHAGERVVPNALIIK